jgi:D-alanyl-lipoteichoic acid acyltransferase DltB (MBOAT superfamily)
MGADSIDLYSVSFWVFVAAAVLILLPIESPRIRKWALAIVNLAFVGFYLRDRVVYIAGGLLAANAILHALRPDRPRLARVVFTLAGAIVLALFLIHKTPDLYVRYAAEARSINPILAIVGFSYVALRWVEVSRSVFEGRSAPPDVPSTINYLIPFHMLAAGPIQAYDEFATQPAIRPPLGAVESLEAFERIAAGLFKKYVLANIIEHLIKTDFRAGFPLFPIELQFNYIWLYLDFSAYSDIAVGIGRLIGAATPENFNRPYLARNMIDYWERWHVSLSLFIRRNVFYPLQLALMRASGGSYQLGAASLAFAVSFLLCGLWHQVSWNWLAWGGYHAAGLVVCNAYRAFLLKRLGRKGLNRYMENRWIKWIMIVITFEYTAISLMLVTGKIADSFWWRGIRP